MNQNTFCKYCHRIPSQCNCTYPVKELTDKEIIQINKDEGTCWDVPDRFVIQIARAILRKAQEK